MLTSLDGRLERLDHLVVSAMVVGFISLDIPNDTLVFRAFAERPLEFLGCLGGSVFAAFLELAAIRIGDRSEEIGRGSVAC